MVKDITYMYTGNYNFNLDNSLVFGIEREDDSNRL